MLIQVDSPVSRRSFELPHGCDALRPLVDFVVRHCPSTKSIFLVGSRLRSEFIPGGSPVNDVDLVVEDVTADQLSKLPGCSCNFFGGTTFRLRDVAVDIWPIAETYHIREFKMAPTVESFIRGAPFNLDKIAYDLLSHTLYDGGCQRGVAEKRIVYAPAHPYFEDVQAARCIVMWRRTGFTLDESARVLLRRGALALRDHDCSRARVRRYFLRTLTNAAIDEILREIEVIAQE